MKNLIVVDDQDVFREPLCEALRQKGYTVYEAADGGAAIELAERHQPDLALVDVRMPEMDGIDLVRALQGRVRTSNLPVILMTANARREDIALGSSLGIRDFLLKSSFSLNDLIARIEERLKAAIPSPPSPPATLRDSGAVPHRTVLPVSQSSHAGSRVSSTPSSSPVSQNSSNPASLPASSVASGSSSRFPGAEAAESPLRGPLLSQAEVRALPAPVAEIMRLAASNTASLAQVQAVIRRDPVLAERVMSASASIGVRGTAPVESLEDALRVLGVEQLVRVVASLPVYASQELAGRCGQEMSQLWAHGIASAVFSERLAPPSERLASFLHGLFHVLPSLVALQTLGEDGVGILAEARREGRSGVDAVALAFGQPANVFAEGVLSRMRLPDSVISVVREWHRDRLRRGAKTATDACRRLDAATCLATGCGFGWNDISSIRPLSNEESRSWHAPDMLDFDLSGLKRHVFSLQKAAGLPETPDTSVLAGLWEEEDSDTLYWRDSRFRHPDPVELALSGRHVKRLESPERLLQPTRSVAVACAEPGSPWWSALLNAPGPLILIHCAPVATSPVRETVRLLQAPIPLYLLLEAVGGG